MEERFIDKERKIERGKKGKRQAKKETIKEKEKQSKRERERERERDKEKEKEEQ
jgi:hypothetical protein